MFALLSCGDSKLNMFMVRVLEILRARKSLKVAKGFPILGNIGKVGLLASHVLSVVTTVGPFINPYNGHNYTRYDGISPLKSGMNALQICAKQSTPFQDFRNYVATFTSKEEFEWAASKGLITTVPALINGRTSYEEYALNIHFDYSPEEGYLVFDQLTGRPYSYFQAPPDAPSGLSGCQLMAVLDGASAPTQLLIGFQNQEDLSSSIICEYGGVQDPFLSQIDTTGGIITVTRLSGFNIASLSLQFVGTTSFGCISISRLNSTSASCTILPGTGAFNVTITDGVKTAVVPWSFNAPYLKSVYPPLNLSPGTNFIIYGGNFGTITAKIQIYVTSQKFPCTIQSVKIPGQAYEISYAADISGYQLLPITIVVDNVQSYLTMVPIWDTSSKSFFSPFPVTMYFDPSLIGQVIGLADENIGAALGLIESPVTANLLKSTYPLFYNTTKNQWTLFEDFFFQGISPRRASNPNLAANFYSTNIPNTALFQAKSPYFDLSTFIISPAATSADYYKHLAQYIPNVQVVGGTILVNTTGDSAKTVQLTSYGSRFGSSQNFRIDDNLIVPVEYDPINNYGLLIINIAPGYGSSTFNISTDGRTYQTTIEYGNPVISGATNIGTTGGAISIVGYNYYILNSVITIKMGPITCSNPNIVVAHKTIVCNMPASSGKGMLVVQVGSKPSVGFNWSYQDPFISGATVSSSPNTLTISGSNFGPLPTNILVFVTSPKLGGDVPCTEVLLPTPHTQITAKVPKTAHGRMVNVYVSVSNVKSNNTASVILTPYLDSLLSLPFTEGGSVDMVAYFDSVDDVGNPITAVDMLVNNSAAIPVTCKVRYTPPTKAILSCPMPAGFYPFLVSIVTPYGISNQIAATYSKPNIVSVSPLKYLAPGLVTISGNSFGDLSLPLYAAIGNFTNMQNCTNARIIDPYRIECFYDASITAPADPKRSLNVTITTTFGSTTKEMFIYATTLSCPNNCSSHGTCNTDSGDCICEKGYLSSADCSVADGGNNGGKPETNENGTTTIPVKGLNFTISITHLRELDMDDVPIKTLPISDALWVNEQLNENSMQHNGIFDNDTAVISIVSTYYPNSSTIIFAGQEMVMPTNSIKYEITVSNWTWQDQLSQLQVIYNSFTDQSSTIGCDNDQVAQTNVTTSTDGDTIYWFQIQSGNTIMNAKFSNRMIVDERIIRASVKLLDHDDELYLNVSSTGKFNVLTAITTPYFDDRVVLDPSFSALLQYKDQQQQDECATSDPSKWKLIVIVVCSAIGGLAVATISVISYKRWKLQRKSRNKLNRLAKMNQDNGL
ncbi:hypothetical protein DFA_07505 [Cavenderia fasciculata]|uniref:EGF-like domain-containing protein n=1 Tax=Cavenderia fasciculata TaxID=261658 RepID=F4PWL7_CACFS|nr:uncharacterized protein DFA_07505 [Cavenderia fasciculata]EGG20381.1 hypothetical protein DFA_07505 [Cavenderia fasciculata]|eukprot:XP_004367364.1 hypothetical protein DFA_07505 [Cavenderia fasciculata]